MCTAEEIRNTNLFGLVFNNGQGELRPTQEISREILQANHKQSNNVNCAFGSISRGVVLNSTKRDSSSTGNPASPHNAIIHLLWRQPPKLFGFTQDWEREENSAILSGKSIQRNQETRVGQINQSNPSMAGEFCRQARVGEIERNRGIEREREGQRVCCFPMCVRKCVFVWLHSKSLFAPGWVK